MRRAARAIIIHDDKLLVTHRNKFGQEYDILIGGGVDFGESVEEALHREIREESGIQIANPRLVFIEDAGEPYGVQYVFLCDYVGGEPRLNPDSMEQKINSLGQNLYTPQWRSLADLPQTAFRSDRLKEAILQGLKKGFPLEAVNLTPQ